MNGKGYKIRMLFSCQTLLELRNGPGFMLRLNYKFTSSYPKPVYIFFFLLNTKDNIFKNVCNKADLGHLSYGTSTSRGKKFGSIDACSAFPFKKLKT